ncbi:FAD-dependent oxidoreductase [Flammeovirga sp. SubArs3]|uniref:NAD(P)/FAD-dependent oxidoreductase n=1 Tax=Flammeovirga sp. SubArs3 TaxID=2995316 RepID=UPI00248AF681|nr:FAD-dependent oxidoreductase [Flammeovirga sp. SubArs3]
MISFWEKDSFIQYDLIIAGSGIVGLSTAIEFKEKNPSKSVLILEKGIFPTGASTKNAGFACFGSLTEIIDDLQHYSEDIILSTVEKRYKGLEKLKNRLTNFPFDYHQYGGYELISKEQLHYLDQLQEVNKLLEPIFKAPVFLNVSDKIAAFKFSNAHVQQLLFNQFEGQIHTGKMMKGLLSKARQLDIEIITGVEVIDFYDEENRVIVQAHHELQKVDFYSEQLCICINGFTNRLLPQLNVNPGRGQVLITSPIQNLPFKGTFHYDRGYYYFRNVGDRVLFGGGRHLDYEGETTTSLQTTPYIQQQLESLLKEVILPKNDFTIDMRWSGIMGFGDQKAPIVKLLSDRIGIGVRMGGMGVAIGSEVGTQLAGIM